MKNHSIVVDGERKWISRHMAVAGFVLSEDGYILANRRGEGSPDFVGYWNCPCGYLDYDETTSEAVVREIFEETGVKLDSDSVELFGINDDPKDSNRQNVTFRFKAIVENKDNYKTTDSNSEEEEVSEIKWIHLDDIDKYQWAFNHDKIIKEIIW